MFGVLLSTDENTLYANDKDGQYLLAFDVGADGTLANRRHFATYESKGFYADMRSWSELDAAERARRGDPYWQVWRIEGPGAVIHFKGHPHVHAYVNVVRDPSRQNVGESLGATPRTLEGDAMSRLLEDALVRATGETLAWHGPQSPGRFCAGPVTTGLAYALDPYGNRVVVAEIEGRAMSEALRAHLARRGVTVGDRETVRIATIDYVVLAARLGEHHGVERHSPRVVLM